jgi:hypothetical protein
MFETFLIIVLLVAMVALLFGFLKLMDLWASWPHRWKYRNPYDRTCKICGRHEQEECWADEYARYGMRARGIWEVYREGDPKKHEKGS